MIATMGLVVVIYLGLRQPQKVCEPFISGLLSLRIVLNRLRSVTPVTRKIPSHPGPLHLVIIDGPFTEWGMDFIHCNPTSARAINTYYGCPILY
jgi:hypothetical protein